MANNIFVGSGVKVTPQLFQDINSPDHAGVGVGVRFYDQTVRQQVDGFDGLERVFALVPADPAGTKWNRVNLQHKPAWSSHGSDFHHAFAQASVEGVMKHGVAIGADTNTGTLWFNRPEQNFAPWLGPADSDGTRPLEREAPPRLGTSGARSP